MFVGSPAVTIAIACERDRAHKITSAIGETPKLLTSTLPTTLDV